MTTLRHFLFSSLLVVLAACGSVDKYPYPPQFVDVDAVPTRALDAPPAKFSAEYNNEIKTIIARQAKLTDAQKEVIAAENHISPEMIVYPVLGKQYSQERYPALYALLKHAASDAWRIGDAAQDYWQSPRPWYADSRVQLLVPSITRPGYPSGHTTTNTVWAYVLAELFPEKREQLLARALEIGNHRIDGGAHFPHDIAGGRKLAKIIYYKMRETDAYRSELSAARDELKEVPRTRDTLDECEPQEIELIASAMCH